MLASCKRGHCASCSALFDCVCVCARLRARPRAGDERLSERECELFMEIADVNADGQIQYRELVKYLTQ